MNEQERIRLLLDVQEHPENYTDEQLDRLLQDEELAALLEELALTKRALMRHKVSHLSSFTRHLSPITSHLSPFKVAASFIGILLLSGIAFAAVHVIQRNGLIPNRSNEGGENAVAVSARRTNNLPSREDLEGALVLFDNVPLDSIIMELATYYNKVADIRSERAHDVRLYYKWHREDSLSIVVSDLNHFDRVNMVVEDDKLIVKP